MTADDSQCVSASADGSCIVWALAGLAPYTRTGALFAPNFFTSAVYFADESQILTCGTDRKITYWDAVDLQQVIYIYVYLSLYICIFLCIYFADESQILTCGTDRKITYWDAVDLQQVRHRSNVSFYI